MQQPLCGMPGIEVLNTDQAHIITSNIIKLIIHDVGLRESSSCEIERRI